MEVSFAVAISGGSIWGPGGVLAPPTLKIFLKKKKFLNFVFYFYPPKLFSFQFGPPIFIRLGPPLVAILLYVTFFFPFFWSGILI